MRLETEGGPSTSIAAVQNAIVAEMSDLPDAMARYEHLIRLGKEFQTRDERVRQEANRVAGCQVSVWIYAEVQDGVLRIAADSDALINRGIIALLLRVLDGRPPGEILESDLFFLERTGLATHLSPARSNGLAAMVRRIRELAASSTG